MKWVLKLQDLQILGPKLDNFYAIEVVNRGSETQLQLRGKFKLHNKRLKG